jgi:hypothetical protein
MRRTSLLVLVLCLIGTVSAQVSYGLRVEANLPASELGEFIAAPVTYTLRHGSAQAFLEIDRWGVTASFRRQHVEIGAYYILTLQQFLGQHLEGTIGVYGGLRRGETYLTVRSTLLLYGSIPKGDADDEP